MTIPAITLQVATPVEYTNTFDILIKNIWGTSKLAGETPLEYAQRVWVPILGSKGNEEAKVIFSSGNLSVSQDYEFTIVETPVWDEQECKVADKTYLSHWRLRLARSTADYDSIGKLVPGATRNGAAGDYFFFTGIDLPHAYVLWAEERLDDYKSDALAETKEIKPTWVVNLDKVRINNLMGEEATTLMSQLSPGRSVTLKDSRFIPERGSETLYIQSMTITYNEPTDTEANILPDLEIVLGSDYTATANPVQQLSGEVNALREQVGALSNVAQVVRATGDKVYLRKDAPDRTPHGIAVGGGLTAEQGLDIGNYREGSSGGKIDRDGNAELGVVKSRGGADWRLSPGSIGGSH